MKVLVAAASRHGATAEIAEAIRGSLVSQGLEADLREASEVTDLDGYDAVVLGSAVYLGGWLEPARRLVDEHGDELAALPLWLFSSGPLGDPPHPSAESAVQIDAIAGRTRPREHRLFAGRLDKARLGFGERAVMLAVRAPEGDFRDWTAIRDWAAQIADALSGGRR